MNENAFYEEAAKELQENRPVPGVWARAFAESDGDENRVRAAYIKMRVAELAEKAPAEAERARTRDRAFVRIMPAPAWIVTGVMVVSVIIGAVVLNRPVSTPQEVKSLSVPNVAAGRSMPEGGDAAAVSWERVNERWVRNTYASGAVTMSDKDTGRMWTFNANLCGKSAWPDAVASCDNLIYAGYSDWRLPLKDELSDQFSQQGCFLNVQDDYYWSGTSYEDFPDHAWFVNMHNGYTGSYYRNYTYCVWPVRGGQSEPF